MATPLKIGLLGASRIAVDAILKPAISNDEIEVFGVAARSPERAKEYAETHNIPHVAQTYDALMQHPEVDIIYIGLPPAQHCGLAIQALQAGKHVLCEKPFALNADEAERMVETAAATKKHLIEGYHYRFHPLFEKVLELCAHPDFGQIESVSGHFEIAILDHPNEFRYQPDQGGGALMDLGCYPLHWAKTLIAEKARVIEAQCMRHTSGVDLVFSARLAFQGGAEATISCDMSPDLKPGMRAHLTVKSATNKVHVDNPVQPGLGSSLTLTGALGPKSYTFTQETFPFQLQHVLERLRGDTVALTGGQDAVDTMVLIDEMRRAAGLDIPGQSV